MSKKAAFVVFQVIALLSVLATIAVIAVSSISFESNYNRVSTGNSGEVVILESNPPTPSSDPVETPSQNSDPNGGGQIDMSRFGKTNEDSPLYQQCMQELNEVRSGLINLQNQNAQYSAEYNDLIARIQASTDPTKAQNLSASAGVKMQQLQDSYTAVSNYQNAHPSNWSCGWSGKFYF
jgi:hypothetical protein